MEDAASTLIGADQTFALGTVLFGLVAFAMWCEKFNWGKAVSAPVIILILSMVLSNVGLVPNSTPLYSGVSSVLVPLAIPLLLFDANLKKVFKESGPVLIAFFVAVVATVVGAIVAAGVMDIGPDEAVVTGILTASYVGGSMNFVASAEALGFTDPDKYVAALAADVLGAVVFLVGLMLLPTLKFAHKIMPSKFSFEANTSNEVVDTSLGDGKNIESGLGIINALFVSALVCAVAKLVSNALGMGQFFILFVTVFALIIANMRKALPIQMKHEFEVGTFFMFFFFAAIGAGADIPSVLNNSIGMLQLIILIVIMHFILVFIMGKLFKLDLAELMVASNACILGPATAAALAAGRGWRDLVTPGILVGVLGYAIGTFIGVALAEFLA